MNAFEAFLLFISGAAVIILLEVLGIISLIGGAVDAVTPPAM